MAFPAVEEKLITEDELMALGSDAMVEVVDGKVVDVSPVGGTHHFIAGNIYDLLKDYVKPRQLGYVMMDGLIYILAKQGKGLKGARVPDVSYIRKTDIPKKWNMDHPFPGAPTLAVEVMSPDDKSEDVIVRVRDFLTAGSQGSVGRTPSAKEVHQYRRVDLETVRVYAGDTALDGGDLFPELKIALGDVFALPDLS